MVGIFSSFMLAGMLTANPSGFNFEGPKVSAQTTGSTGYFTQGALPFTDLFERGTGSAQLTVQDRISVPQAIYGDVGRLEATFTLGATVYRVELDQAGFAPNRGLQGFAPAQPISGGVVLNQDMHGGAPIGSPTMTRVRAAAAVWGVGKLYRNGQLLTDTALIHAAALEQGAHADDDTFRTLPVARPGDVELNVLVWNLPPSVEPRGFIQFDFDDVSILRDGTPVPAVAVVPNAGVFYGVAPASSPVVGGAALGSVALSNASSQQGTGGSGLAAANQTVVDGLADPTRTEQLAPYADVTLPVIANQQGNQIPQAFRNDGRVALSVAGITTGTTTSSATTPLIADNFRSAERVGTANGGTSTAVSATAQTPQGVMLSSTGSYAVLPQVSGPGFAFGGPWVSASIVSTPSPGNTQSPAVPLIGSPQPLNSQVAVPLIAAPQPLNAQFAQPLIAAPQPLGVQASSGAIPGAVTPVATPSPTVSPAGMVR